MNLPSNPARLMVLMAVLFALLAPRPSAANTESYSLGPEWAEAVATLQRLPVQDTGFVRTGRSFSENLISAIAGTTSVNRVPAMESLLALMRNPNVALNAPLIKISHPDLVDIYGTTQITANQWRDPSYRDMLMQFLQVDQEKRLSPLNSIEYRSRLIEDIESEFAIVPRDGEWLTPAQARRLAGATPEDQRIVEQWDALMVALRANDAGSGTTASRSLVDAVTAAAVKLDKGLPPLGLEMFYHSHKPFRNAAVLYLFSSLLFVGGLLLAKPGLNWAGLALLGVGFVEHALGLGIRWILAERGPFSNMYESFVFAIGGMVLVALILEASRSVRLVGLGAAILGFIFMVIAHKAPIFDSQIRPLVPALQSSWLTYHVVTIMLSYSAFALSFFVSILYLLKDKVLGGDAGKGFLATRLPGLRAMDVFNYRIIAIGFPLLTLGIVAGAVWAATAWGRPWGFDPKETWSAITWLVYAVYLHIRYMAGWSARSAAVISIIGFLCVLFTYFGVNYLLSGLHSYV